MNFRTSYTDIHGSAVTNSRAIAVNYLKGWFLIDVISCASMVGYFMPGDDNENFKDSAKASR